MSLNSLPRVSKQSILDFLPVQTMEFVNKEWQDIIPNEGHLYLRNQRVTDKTLARILKHLQEKHIKIVSIDLSLSTITDASLALLASSHLPIQRLNLKECLSITNEGLKHLAALPIQRLNLRTCHSITNEGLKHLTALPLTHLNLQDCFKINDAGVKYLTASHLLTELTLSFTDVTDKGLGYLTHLRLTKLKLLGCDKVSRFIYAFPFILFPHVPRNLGSDYTEEYRELFSKWSSKIDVQNLRQKIAEKLPPICLSSALDIMKSYVDSDLSKMYAEDALSPLLPPQLRLFSSHVDSELRTSLVEQILAPLTDPLPSIQPLISPLYTFAKREMATDPKFVIYFNRPIAEKESTSGQYTPSDGNIEIFIQSKQEELDATCLLHELGHKAFHKLGWKTAGNHTLEAQTRMDISALECDDWADCHPLVTTLLKGVDKNYRREKCFEEYLVRMPEIITHLAKENPSRSTEWIETQIKKDLPHLYAIYTKEFIPKLRSYNVSK